MSMLISTLVVALVFQSAPAGQTTTGGQAPPAAQRARTATLEVRVTDRTGVLLEGATVIAEGPVPREGTTNADGSVTLRNLTGGTYRLRLEHDEFVALEKEVSVKAGAPMSVYAALTPAPPKAAPQPAPVPPPAPKPAPAAPMLTPGDPRVIAIPEFAEKQLITNRETTKETPLGCSGATASRLIQIRAPLAAHSHADADEVLYVVAGDATLMLGDAEHRIGSGSLAIVPRGLSHTVTRRGGNPVILISIVGGPLCK